MNLVVLHGPPACGKYTVGRELAAQTGFRFFHNHLVVDALLAVFEFGSPAFIDLREEIWRSVFVRAGREGPSGLIFTFSPENTVRQEFVDWLFRGLDSATTKVWSVALAADEAAIERRLGSAARREFGKLTDLDLYRRLRAAGAFASPIIPRTDCTIDTTRMEAAESARQIVRALSLA